MRRDEKNEKPEKSSREVVQGLLRVLRQDQEEMRRCDAIHHLGDFSRFRAGVGADYRGGFA